MKILLSSNFKQELTCALITVLILGCWSMTVQANPKSDPVLIQQNSTILGTPTPTHTPMQTPGNTPTQTTVQPSKTVLLTPMEKTAVIESVAVLSPGNISDCKLETINGNEMVFTLDYQITATLSGPVYYGGYLYDNQKQAINAGYKPAAIGDSSKGRCKLTLVLPKTPFHSSYIEVFLIHAQKIFATKKFLLPFLWDGFSGRILHPDTAAAGSETVDAVLQNKADFCERYANDAVTQYEYAKSRKLEGIFPPAWSNDRKGHYTWCLTVPEDVATRESNKRKDHIFNHQYTPKP